MRTRFNQLMESLDGVTEQRLVFNEDTLTVTRRRDEKLLCGVKSQDLSPEFYRSENIIQHEVYFPLDRGSALEQVGELHWQNCLQPKCASLCPWSGHVWVCASGSRSENNQGGKPPAANT